mgnify:CR=1 FL=1
MDASFVSTLFLSLFFLSVGDLDQTCHGVQPKDGGWMPVSHVLPRSRPVQHLYKVSLTEKDFIASYAVGPSLLGHLSLFFFAAEVLS